MVATEMLTELTFNNLSLAEQADFEKLTTWTLSSHQSWLSTCSISYGQQAQQH